ncbi:DUF6449 domain-containing protein [Thalassobacillus sp. B23F22_16]|uniref:DUF6449 domain-containing protein n=1 Tax=Thalassobacillus sp. B23F22_16 TaxID=3459513 RepID=UPI00373EC839
MLKTSSFKKEVTKQNFRSVGWIGIVYLAGLLFALPLKLMMEVSSDRPLGEYFYQRGLFQVNFEIQQLLMIVLPVLLAVFLFRYLHMKESSDFIHSLPLKRKELYHINIWNGLVILVSPILITTLIIAIITVSYDLSGIYEWSDLWYWAGGTLSYTLLLFFSTVFVGMLTGMSAVQGVLTYIMLLFPAGITVLFYFVLDRFLYGFSTNYYMDSSIEMLSPLSDSLNLFNGSLPAIRFIIYTSIAVFFYGLAWVIYKHRKLEMAGQAIVYNGLRPLFKYGLTFCMMLVGGLYFQSQPAGWVIFGYVVGSLVGYTVAEMVLQKTWRVFGKWKGYLGFSVVTFLVFFMLEIDVTGYEKAIPEAGNVERVFIGEGSYTYKNKNEMMMSEAGYLTSAENIEAIRNLHQQIVETGPPDDHANRKRNIFLAYEEKDQGSVIREYIISEDQLQSALKPIYESEEYKLLKYPVLHVDSEDIENIRFYVPGKEDENIVITNAEKIASLVKQLKQDLDEETFDKRYPLIGDQGEISFSLSDGTEFHVPIKRSYDRFNDWLQEQQMYEDIILTADDISKAVIMYGEGDEGTIYNRFEKAAASSDHVWTITDPEKVEMLLNRSGNDNQGSYFVALYYKGGYPEMIYRVPEDFVSRIIK